MPVLTDRTSVCFIGSPLSPSGPLPGVADRLPLTGFDLRFIQMGVLISEVIRVFTFPCMLTCSKPLIKPSK